MSSWSWSAARVADPDGLRAAVSLQVFENHLLELGRPSIPYMIWSGPAPAGRSSRKRSVSHSMNAEASSVKPSRRSAYSEKAASRIQV